MISVIPFIGLLLCIAICPLVIPELWEKYKPAAVAFWIAAFFVTFGMANGFSDAFETALDSLVSDYLTFIVLLFGLFCVAGNISFDGDVVGAPRTNVMILILGSILSSIIGTTGASMLMVRPILKMNSWRSKKAHIMVFFIFTISNLGGCLTPIGDPPLLMGFTRGVPFFWSLHLFPIFVLNLAVLLFIFYHIDRKAYQEDIAKGMHPDISVPKTEIKLLGMHNIIFIAMIIFAVILNGIMSGTDNSAGIHLYGDVVMTWSSIIEMAIILLAAFLSFKTTSPVVRKKNHFTWGAIQEVAILFVGIFITMQPALDLMQSMGSSLGITHAWQMFWVTGALSSFLDNTPTYLVFLTTAGALKLGTGIVTTVGQIPVKMLMAVSAGAVLMGANTYIGNAPNFMVKSISDENGIHMPSFFGYMLYSIRILIPVFILDTILFFIF